MGFLEEIFEGVLEDFFNDFLGKIFNVFTFWRKPKKGKKKEVVKPSKGPAAEGKKDAKVEERKREEEPFGIKHVLIALGCVALMAAFIHLLAYILIVIVLMIVLAVGAQVLFVAASANTTPAALKKELERAKASGEVSDILFLKIVRAMTTMQDGAEKQQVMSMSFELLRELDPKRYEEMTEDMKKELQELQELQQLLGHQTVSVTESEVDRHSESNQCLDDNMEATAVIGLVQELESQEALTGRETLSSCGEHEDVALRRSQKDKKKHKNPLKAMLRSVKRAD